MGDIGKEIEEWEVNPNPKHLPNRQDPPQREKEPVREKPDKKRVPA